MCWFREFIRIFVSANAPDELMCVQTALCASVLRWRLLFGAHVCVPETVSGSGKSKTHAANHCKNCKSVQANQQKAKIYFVRMLDGGKPRNRVIS